MLEGILSFARPAAGDTEPPSLLTDFERWCEERRLHPEEPGAWEGYERSVIPAV